MSSKGQRFAQAVLDAFAAAGNDTDVEVHSAGGPSSSTMTKFRHVAEGGREMGRPRGDVLRGIDLAARWEQGSAKRLWAELEGSRPTPAEDVRRRLVEEIRAAHLDKATEERLLDTLGEDYSDAG